MTAQKAIGAGIPTLPRTLVEKILQWEYVDFNDLPPARGNTKHSTIKRAVGAVGISGYNFCQIEGKKVQLNRECQCWPPVLVRVVQMMPVVVVAHKRQN